MFVIIIMSVQSNLVVDMKTHLIQSKKGRIMNTTNQKPFFIEN